MNAISSKTLTPEVRSEIIRDLVTHMYGCVEKPTSQFCKFVAQRLILKYPFMRDGKGTGYVSICVIILGVHTGPGRKTSTHAGPFISSCCLYLGVT